MGRKKWIVNEVNKELAAQLAEECRLNPFVSFLAVSRGIKTEEEIEEFFSDDTNLTDPFELKDMDKAVDRINEAIYDFQRIAVYGDYDADGITATAVMYSYLESQGADVIFYIPDRLEEGYGLSCEAIDKLNDAGVKLIVTVDNGISSIEETKYAKTLGIDLVITDHHKAGAEIPDAVAVVDPHRKDCPSSFKEWAGVGVAYKLVSAIEGGEPDELLQYFADLILIGTVADIVPLVGENRKLVKKGLEIINQRGRIGIEALREISGTQDKEITAGTIAFGITPRINAVGRMKSAETALKLLLCEDKDEALDLAREIDEQNTQRQKTEQGISNEVNEILNSDKMRCYDKVIIVDGEGWHNGVTGIVASRIVERFGKPCIVISINDGVSRGSGRSVEGFSLYDALEANSEFLTHYGGHTMAAGMGVKEDKIDAFRKAINDYASTVDFSPVSIKLDCKLNPMAINDELLYNLQAMEPFGSGNPQPLFGLYSMRITEIQPVGNGKHLRLTLTKMEKTVTAMKFGVCASEFPFKVGDLVDVAVRIERNEFMGRVRPSVHIFDMKMSGSKDEEILTSIATYEKYIRNEPLTKEEIDSLIPQRDDMAKIYRYIKSNGGWRYEMEFLYSRLGEKIDLSKIMIATDVFKEMKLFDTDENENIILPKSEEKVNLDDSKILANLKNLKGR